MIGPEKVGSSAEEAPEQFDKKSLEEAAKIIANENSSESELAKAVELFNSLMAYGEKLSNETNEEISRRQKNHEFDKYDDKKERTVIDKEKMYKAERDLYREKMSPDISYWVSFAPLWIERANKRNEESNSEKNSEIDSKAESLIIEICKETKLNPEDKRDAEAIAAILKQRMTEEEWKEYRDSDGPEDYVYTTNYEHAEAAPAYNANKNEKEPGKFRKLLTKLALAASILLGGGYVTKKAFDAFNPANTNNDDKIVEKVDAEETESIETGEQVIEQVEYTKHEQLNQLIDGSFEQYDGPGLYKYEMDKKIDHTAVANTAAIFEYIGINPEAATADDYAEALKYVAFSQKETAAFIAVANGMEGFEDLSYEQAEKKIHEMNEEEKKAFVNQLQDYFNNSSFNLTTSNGSKENHFIEMDENGNTYGVFKEVDTTGMKELEVTFQKEDGSSITIMFEGPCLNGEIKIIKTLPSGKTEITTIKIDNPDPNPNPDPEPDKPDTPDKPSNEWGKTGDPHGGEDVTYSEQVDPNSEVTQVQNANTNSGNEGHNGSTPGSTSSNSGGGSQNSAPVIAPQANSDPKPAGGTPQASGQAGTNSYTTTTVTEEAIKVDNSGNTSQSTSKEDIKPNTDNLTNDEEVRAVEEEDF